MTKLNAIGYFMDYCNRNLGKDENVNQNSFADGYRTILRMNDSCFEACRTAEDVLKLIEWPNKEC